MCTCEFSPCECLARQRPLPHQQTVWSSCQLPVMFKLTSVPIHDVATVVEMVDKKPRPLYIVSGAADEECE